MHSNTNDIAINSPLLQHFRNYIHPYHLQKIMVVSYQWQVKLSLMHPLAISSFHSLTLSSCYASSRHHHLPQMFSFPPFWENFKFLLIDSNHQVSISPSSHTRSRNQTSECNPVWSQQLLQTPYTDCIMFAPYNISSLFLPLAPALCGKPKFHKNWSTCRLLHSDPAHLFLQQPHSNEEWNTRRGADGPKGLQGYFPLVEWPFLSDLINKADRHTLLNHWAKCSRSHQNDRPEDPLFIPPCSIKISNKSSICWLEQPFS